MSNIELIKKLRDITSAGLSDCKKALEESNGDIDEAQKWLRSRSLSILDNKTGRETANGCVILKIENGLGVIAKIQSETDFASKSEIFLSFAREFINFLFKNPSISNEEIQDIFKSIIVNSNASSLGENIVLGGFFSMKGKVFSYMHDAICNTEDDKKSGIKIGKIGVLALIESDCADEKISEIGQNICMHIACYKPQFIERKDVTQNVIDDELSVLKEKLKETGEDEKLKKNNIDINQILNAKLEKVLSELCLYDQKLATNDSLRVRDYLNTFSSPVQISDFKIMISGK